jgi:hypothetical protein
MGVSGSKERATFSLSADVKNRLDEQVPKNERSRYVNRALDRALKEDARESLRRFLDELPMPSGGEDSTETLRRLRREWDGRPPAEIDGQGE